VERNFKSKKEKRKKKKEKKEKKKKGLIQFFSCQRPSGWKTRKARKEASN